MQINFVAGPPQFRFRKVLLLRMIQFLHLIFDIFNQHLVSHDHGKCIVMPGKEILVQQLSRLKLERMNDYFLCSASADVQLKFSIFNRSI